MYDDVETGPPQRLFFKPPDTRKATVIEVNDTPRATRNPFEIAKEGIESLMEKLQADLRIACDNLEPKKERTI